MARKVKENGFDLNDLLEQMKQINKMGSLKSIIGMIPGANKIDTDSIDEKQLVHIQAIILSMTREERAKPSIIDPKRKRRIAAGSGMKVEDVNRLLKQYDSMVKMMKQFGMIGNGKGTKGGKGAKRRKMPFIPKMPGGFGF